MQANIETFRDVNSCWRWRLVASNGEILATSEAYSCKRACKDTAKLLAETTDIKIMEK